MISRGKTAIGRTELSRPFQLAAAAGLLDDVDTVFDYGCGRGDDVRALSALGHDCVGWDPAHNPDTELRPSDLVNLGYVVNVIEDPTERAASLKRAWDLAHRALIVAARVDIQAAPEESEAHADGVLTSRGTFQKFFTQPELRDWIDATLDVRSVAAGPGVFFVFRSERDRQRYTSALVRRRLTAPLGRVSEALFEEHRALVEPLVQFFEDRGRLPAPEELDHGTEIAGVFGSIPKAFRAVRNALGDGPWHEIEDVRRGDLLVYLALQKFRGRARYSELPTELQYDMKAFFGSYNGACREADALLFGLRDTERTSELCGAAPVGKVTPEALYFHRSALERLPVTLRIYEGCARVVVGEIEGANIIKLERGRPKVSYLSYPAFDTVAHPALASSVVVWLDTMIAKFYDFTRRGNPPVLHRKEAFVPDDYPDRERFAKLTHQEERRDLLSDPSIGTRRGWEDLLGERGFKIAGHVLRKA